MSTNVLDKTATFILRVNAWSQDLLRNLGTHVAKQTVLLLFLSFRRVLNVIYSFLGNSPASENSDAGELPKKE